MERRGDPSTAYMLIYLSRKSGPRLCQARQDADVFMPDVRLGGLSSEASIEQSPRAQPSVTHAVFPAYVLCHDNSLRIPVNGGRELRR